MYNEILFQFDLAILAYHIYAQTLKWPWDPYYEKMRYQGTSRRNNFMGAIREKNQTGDFDKDFDPILYDYSRIDPTKSAIFKPDGSKSWELFSPIGEIANKLRVLNIVKEQKLDQTIKLNANSVSAPAPKDEIWAFEGKTGLSEKKDKLETDGQKSIMGFVLVRYDESNPQNYDVHIAFRGSRSGNAMKAGIKAKLFKKGNADWVTDMQLSLFVSDTEISPVGNVSRGFASSVHSMKDNIIFCLEQIKAQHTTAPQNITIAGHSLGGALSGLFATWLNTQIQKYDNHQNGESDEAIKKLITGTQNSPSWEHQIRKLHVFTYGSPIYGDRRFSDHFNSKIWCTRVKVNIDPVTTDIKGFHGGARIEFDANAYGPLATSNHEYLVIREKIKKGLGLTSGIPDDPIENFKNFLELYNKIAGHNDPSLTIDKLKQKDQKGIIIDYVDTLRTALKKHNSYLGNRIFNPLKRRDAYFSEVVDSTEWDKNILTNYDLNAQSFQSMLRPTNDNDDKWRNQILLAIFISRLFFQNPNDRLDNGNWISNALIEV